MKSAIFSIAIGDQYIDHYEKVFKPSVVNYAKRNNYDFFIINDFLTDIKTHDLISFHKHIIPLLDLTNQYETVLFLDADILVNPNSPPFHTLIQDKIGVVDEFSQPNFETRLQYQIKNNFNDKNPTEYYNFIDSNFKTDIMINSGMFIFKPKIHKDFFYNLVNKYIKQQINHPRGFHFEKATFGYELQSQKNFTILDNKWNSLWALYKDENSKNIYKDFVTFFNNNYFIHMVGNCDHDLAHLINFSEN